MIKSNIYLIGFMGTGKSTVSTCLAKQLGYEEIDTDAQIVEHCQRSIAEIFATQGEQKFRDMETELLQKLCKEKNKIISCGGGMALRKENVALMRQNGTVVLLTAQPETILSRVKNDNGRPILNENMSVEYIGELLGQRLPYYEEAGELMVATDGRLPDDIAEEISAYIRKLR